MCVLVDTIFKQQRFPSWRPILHVGNSWPIFLGIAVAFISLGIVILVYSSFSNEYSIDYTKCKAIALFINGNFVWNASDEVINWTSISNGLISQQSTSNNLTCDMLVNDSSKRTSEFVTCICAINFMLQTSLPVSLYIF